MHSVLVVVLLVTTTAAQSLTRCTNHATGYCISMFDESCPSGTYISYSGCGFLEQCCYIPASQVTVPTHTGTTQSPVQPTSECGVSSYNSAHKIVGGTATVIQKYPWQISLQYRGYHNCGGSIISDRWILTAGHCIKEVTQPVYTSQITVIAGSTNQYSFLTSNYYTVQTIIVHPGYVKNTRNDVALIKLSSSISLTGQNKKSICLAELGDDFTGQVCVATGWGSIAEGDDQVAEHILREVSLPIVADSLCRYYIGSMDVNNICAGPRIGGKDTCQGDSGGPLVCQNTQGVWKQAGIVSYGIGCGRVNQFGVYTEVSKFNTWIRDTMSRN